MTQFNIFNVKLPTSQLTKSKLGIKNSTEVTLKISSNVVSYSSDENKQYKQQHQQQMQLFIRKWWDLVAWLRSLTVCVLQT